jgi:hypothetical protein
MGCQACREVEEDKPGESVASLATRQLTMRETQAPHHRLFSRKFQFVFARRFVTTLLFVEPRRSCTCCTMLDGLRVLCDWRQPLLQWQLLIWWLSSLHLVVKTACKG